MKHRLIFLTLLFSVSILSFTAVCMFSNQKEQQQDIKEQQIVAINELEQLAKLGEYEKVTEKSEELQESLHSSQIVSNENSKLLIMCGICIIFGIYKSLGFTSNNLRMQFAVRFLIVAFVGSAIGSILCTAFSGKLLSKLLRLMGISNFAVSFTSGTFLIPIVLICVCFFVFSYVASRKMKKVEIKELVAE